MSELKNWRDWEVVRLIGRGSFGVVYEIERTIANENEKAALKLISIPQNDSEVRALRSEGYDDESITAVFDDQLQGILKEYMTMRKLNGNTNVVNCDDVQTIQRDDGIGWDIFIQMELLEPMAESLPHVVSDAVVIKLGKDICNALSLCSRFNIIHRDIKPQNIFISPCGDYKLGDFGVARTMERTSGGTKIGTYNYMAPEVYNNQGYNHTVDIYSLGLVLYWLLNDRRTPFLPPHPAIPKSSEQENARYRRFRGEALPAPKYGSDALKAVVLKACAFDPKERYQTAEEMKQALEAIPENPAEKEDTTQGVWSNSGKKPKPVKHESPKEPEIIEAPEVIKDPVLPAVNEEPAVPEADEEPAVPEIEKEPEILDEPEKPNGFLEILKNKKLMKYGGIAAAVAIVCLVIALLVPRFASGEPKGDFAYEVLNNGTVRVLEMNDKEKARVEIPAEIKGSVVTEIGSYAFYGCEYLQEVTLPDTVTVIEDNAFDSCVSLREIELPEGVTTIGAYAFQGCSSLVKINLPDALEEIGEFAFCGCSALERVSIPESITTIEDSVFQWCSSLERVIIPDSVTDIGESAFAECTSLRVIDIPDSVHTIGAYAFSWCSALSDVTVPESVRAIGEYAFSSCDNLKKIAIPDSVKSIEYGAISDNSALKNIYYQGDKNEWSDIFPSYNDERKGGYIRGKLTYNRYE